MPENSQDEATVIHRILQADRRRFSLKLEQAYWTVLEEEAARQGLPVARLIQKIVQDSSSQTSLTATLRLYCLNVLHERAAKAPSVCSSEDPVARAPGSPAQALRRLVNFFAACPTAGLLLNRREQVICANRAFEEWSRLRGDHLVGKPVNWHFQLRMPAPVGDVLARFAKGDPQTVAARVSYISPGRIVVANARVSLALWNNPEDFVWGVMIEGSRPALPHPTVAPPGVTTKPTPE